MDELSRRNREAILRQDRNHSYRIIYYVDGYETGRVSTDLEMTLIRFLSEVLPSDWNAIAHFSRMRRMLNNDPKSVQHRFWKVGDTDYAVMMSIWDK